MTTTKVWFVTGASKGLGLSLVKKLLQNGYRVTAATRNSRSLINEIGPASDVFLPLDVKLIRVRKKFSGELKIVLRRRRNLFVAGHCFSYFFLLRQE